MEFLVQLGVELSVQLAKCWRHRNRITKKELFCEEEKMESGEEERFSTYLKGDVVENLRSDEFARRFVTKMEGIAHTYLSYKFKDARSKLIDTWDLVVETYMRLQKNAPEKLKGKQTDDLVNYSRRIMKNFLLEKLTRQPKRSEPAGSISALPENDVLEQKIEDNFAKARVVWLEEKLDEYRRIDEVAYRAFMLKEYGTLEEIAAALSVGRATVVRRLKAMHKWLEKEGRSAPWHDQSVEDCQA